MPGGNIRAMRRPGPKRPVPNEMQLALAERVRLLRDRHFEQAHRNRVELAEAIVAARASGLSWRHLEELTGIRHQTMQQIIRGI